jgi:hypothetical protein
MYYISPCSFLGLSFIFSAMVSELIRQHFQWHVAPWHLHSHDGLELTSGQTKSNICWSDQLSSGWTGQTKLHQFSKERFHIQYARLQLVPFLQYVHMYNCTYVHCSRDTTKHTCRWASFIRKLTVTSLPLQRQNELYRLHRYVTHYNSPQNNV